MDFDSERMLRNQAHVLRANGVYSWADRLLSNGLDPEIPSWLHTKRLAPVGIIYRAAPLAAQSFDAESNTVALVWTTGAKVLRQDYGGPFNEVLDVTPAAVRLGRLNAGAPLLDSHMSGSLASVIGCVVLGSARIAAGKGECRVLLSSAGGAADTVGKIKEGVIRNVSVGYMIHASQWSDEKSGTPTCRVTDWEPFEISAVAVPADSQAQIRSAF